MHRENAAQLKIRVQDDLGLRLPVQPRKFRLDELTPITESQYDLLHAHTSEYAEVPLKKAHAAKSQQAFRLLSVLRQLQAQAPSCCKDDRAHKSPRNQLEAAAWLNITTPALGDPVTRESVALMLVGEQPAAFMEGLRVPCGYHRAPRSADREGPARRAAVREHAWRATARVRRRLAGPPRGRATDNRPPGFRARPESRTRRRGSPAPGFQAARHRSMLVHGPAC